MKFSVLNKPQRTNRRDGEININLPAGYRNSESSATFALKSFVSFRGFRGCKKQKTKNTPGPRLPSPVAARRSRSAFTLIELLAVISIIVILIALVLPALVGAQKHGYVTATEAEFNTIGAALSAYHNDFNTYPNSALASSSGGSMYGGPIPQYAAYEYLAEALIGYLPGQYDNAPGSSSLGANGYTGGTLEQCKGFSMNPYNKVYGPYLDIGAAYIVQDQNSPDANSTPPVPAYYIADSFPASTSGVPMPVLYFSSSGTPTNGQTIFASSSTGGTATGATGTYYIFNEQDNACVTGSPPVASAMNGGPMGTGVFTNFTTSPSPNTSSAYYPMYEFLTLIGNTTGTDIYSSGQNILGANSYLLISAGPDAVYFDNDDVVSDGQTTKANE
ncbi:MAG TPA: type II secretion system protein [Phycisphaerae bacterium]|nr:type II secretion system protein [Phycisphaerae bacterium]